MVTALSTIQTQWLFNIQSKECGLITYTEGMNRKPITGGKWSEVALIRLQLRAAEDGDVTSRIRWRWLDVTPWRFRKIVTTLKIPPRKPSLISWVMTIHTWKHTSFSNNTSITSQCWVPVILISRRAFISLRCLLLLSRANVLVTGRTGQGLGVWKAVVMPVTAQQPHRGMRNVDRSIRPLARAAASSDQQHFALPEGKYC